MSVFKFIIAPLLSMLLCMMANGFFATLMGIKIQELGLSNLMIGLVTSAFYAGIMLGSFKIEHFIKRVGYIRAYVGFASVCAIFSLLQGFYLDMPWVSIVMRFCVGYCIGGFFITLEGWAMCVTTAKNRGIIMALMMITLYLGYSLGQFFVALDFSNALSAFNIVALLLMVSILPMVLTISKAPEIKEISFLGLKTLYKASPTGVLGCFLVGCLTSSIYGMFPVLFKALDYGGFDISLSMFLIVFGGMCGQYPLGKMSDHLGRRPVLLWGSAAGLFFLFLVILIYMSLSVPLLVCFFFFGFFCYPMYPLVLAHTCDVVDPKDFTAAMQRLVLVFGCGSAVAPIVASVFLEIFGAIGILLTVMIILICMIVLFVWRQKMGTQVSVDDQRKFEGVPSPMPMTGLKRFRRMKK